MVILLIYIISKCQLLLCLGIYMCINDASHHNIIIYPREHYERRCFIFSGGSFEIE